MILQPEVYSDLDESLRQVGDEQWCGVTRSRGAAGKHVSVRRREAEAWTYYCGWARNSRAKMGQTPGTREGWGGCHVGVGSRTHQLALTEKPSNVDS